jgi:hypothetical protein
LEKFFELGGVAGVPAFAGADLDGDDGFGIVVHRVGIPGLSGSVACSSWLPQYYLPPAISDTSDTEVKNDPDFTQSIVLRYLRYDCSLRAEQLCV